MRWRAFQRRRLQLLVVLVVAAVLPAADFSGESAFEFTREVVAFGPRPPGSKASESVQRYIRSKINELDFEISDDAFTASTPKGPVRMTNLIARFPGASGRIVVFSGHYDTKLIPGIRFVGANDGGSSAGLLLELARAVAARKRVHDVWIVWFDGEEAYGTWSATDGIYGSRHLAERWWKDDTLSRITALINTDMIGDKDLGILKESYSTRSLQNLVWTSAASLGYGSHFLPYGGPIEDDHAPFLRKGVNAVNLIDFQYGPDNSWWHTEADTLDKLSPRSFEVVGTVVLDVLRRLETMR